MCDVALSKHALEDQKQNMVRLYPSMRLRSHASQIYSSHNALKSASFILFTTTQDTDVKTVSIRPEYSTNPCYGSSWVFCPVRSVFSCSHVGHLTRLTCASVHGRPKGLPTTPNICFREVILGGHNKCDQMFLNQNRLIYTSPVGIYVFRVSYLLWPPGNRHISEIHEIWFWQQLAGEAQNLNTYSRVSLPPCSWERQERIKAKNIVNTSLGLANGVETSSWIMNWKREIIIAPHLLVEI